jgi:transcriptional regulator with XRE-family HTH domain
MTAVSTRHNAGAVPAAPALIYRLLPYLRDRADLSQNDLAHRAQPAVSVNTIQSLEKPANAGRVPDAEILEALAEALGVQPDEFYEYPIAAARRTARPSVARRARRAAQRLDDTQSTSPRTRRAADGEGEDR